MIATDGQARLVPLQDVSTYYVDIMKKTRFRNTNPAGQWLNQQSSKYIRFMRTPAFSDFEYLTYKLDSDLPRGNYTFFIQFDNNVKTNQIHTFMRLRKLNIFGAKNTALEVAFLVTAFFVLLCVVFLLYVSRSTISGI